MYEYMGFSGGGEGISGSTVRTGYLGGTPLIAWEAPKYDAADATLEGQAACCGSHL